MKNRTCLGNRPEFFPSFGNEHTYVKIDCHIKPYTNV